MEAMRAQFERESDLDSPWTSYNSSLGRPLLNSAKFLAPKIAHPPENPPPDETDSAVEASGRQQIDELQIAEPLIAEPQIEEFQEKSPLLPGLKT
jgi:hypothetical protein